MKASERNARFAREEAEALVTQTFRRGFGFWIALPCGVAAIAILHLVPFALREGRDWIGAASAVGEGLYVSFLLALTLGIPAFAAHVVAELLLFGLLKRRLASAWIAFGIGLLGSAVTSYVLLRADRFWTGYWGFTALSVSLGCLASRPLTRRA